MLCVVCSVVWCTAFGVFWCGVVWSTVALCSFATYSCRLLLLSIIRLLHSWDKMTICLFPLCLAQVIENSTFF